MEEPRTDKQFESREIRLQGQEPESKWEKPWLIQNSKKAMR